MNAYNDERRDPTGSSWRPDTGHTSNTPVGRASGIARFSTSLRSSRRTRLLAALALIVVCGLAVPVLASSVTPKSASALAAVHDMPPGTVITAGDLAAVDASGPSGALIPAAEQTSVIGKTVRAEVPAGALLNNADLGSYPPIGESVVPVAVKPGQYPPDLQVGQGVAVYPIATGTTSSTPSAQHAAATATVAQIAPVSGDGSGEVVIDLELPNSSASAVAQVSAVVLVSLDARSDAP